MAKIKRVPRCHNCGEILQSKDPNKKGYVPDLLLNDPVVLKDRVLYCQSCYDALHEVNSGELNESIDDESLKILDDARASDAIVAWVIDLSTFNGTLKKSVVDKIKSLRVAVIATKKDLLPDNVKDDDLKEFINVNFKDNGIKPVYVKIVDGRKLDDYKEAFEAALKYRGGHDVFVIGDKGVGKTTIINNCLKFFVNKTQKSVKTIEYPKTKTLVMELPLSRSSSLYCLPGLSLDTSVVGNVETRIAKVISPKDKMKVTNITLMENEAILLGNLGAFSLAKGKPTQLRVYASKDVMIKKLRSDRINAFLAQNRLTKELKPVSSRFITFRDYDLFEYAMDKDNKRHDVSILGLGWVSLVSKGQVIRVLAPKKCAIKESISKVK